MPPTNADDPLRTTDAEPSAATPSQDLTTDAAPAAPVVAGPQDAAVSVSVPGYEIECVLGRGGMGVVYKARHLALKRTVALKMVLAGGHAGPQERARFRLEAEAVARLQHANIVQIHEVGEADGHPYCALEFVEGGNLAGKLQGQPLPAREAAKLVGTLARAMQLAHSRNVVHRDLKPANVLLTADGTPKITDFGLARQLDSDSGATQAGAVMGTPSYMAPEQASGRAHEAGPAADIYALGAILYECLAGRPPFKGQTVVETLDQVRTQEPVPPSRFQPAVPLDLETICLKCLRKEPEKRYTSAAELADDLVRYQHGEPIQARPVGRMERSVKWVKRNPVVAGAGAFAVLTLASGITFGYLKYRETEAALARESLRVTERDEALGKRDTALGDAKEANDKLTHRLGVSAMVLANAAYDSRDYKLAADRLEQVPEEQRGWEWRYLKRLLNGGIFTLHGHTVPVTSVAFSPDGTRVVTGTGLQTSTREAKVWDARTGMYLFDLKGHPPAAGRGEEMSVAFSGDGKRILIADKTARVYDATTGALQLELKVHGDGVNCAAFSPDGTRIATGSRVDNAGLVNVWDARTGKAVFDWRAHETGTTRLAFSPDGTRIVTGGWDQALRVWETQTGKLLLEAKGMTDYDSGVTFSPNGKRIVAGRDDGTARVIDAQTGAVLLELKGRPRAVGLFRMTTGLSVAYSPDGTRIATGGGSGNRWASSYSSASVWDARTGAELLELKGHTGLVMSVAFSPDGERIITGSWDGTAKVWDARTGTPRLQLEGINGTVASAAFSPDGTWLVTGGYVGGGPFIGEATVWDARTGMPKFALQGIKGAFQSVAIGKEGTRIVTGGGDPSPDDKASIREATVWNARTGTALVELKGLTEGVNSVAFSPEGTRIVTAGLANVNSGGWEVKVCDAEKGTVLLDLSERPSGITGGRFSVRGGSVAFSPDGKQIATAFARVVKVRDARTGAVLVEMKDNKRPVLSVAFSPDGTRIAAGRSDNAATVWDAQTGTAPVELSGHVGMVSSVAFSPDGKRVVTGSGDTTVRVWDARTGTTLAELKGHSGAVMSVSFSADGTRILTASGPVFGKPSEVIVWDARMSKEPPDEEEIAYRRLHTQPNPSRYRAGYLAARVARDDFAAAFYLNLLPPDERKALIAQADADVLAAMSKLAREHESAGKPEEAVPLLTEILNVNKAKLGPEDPATIQAADSLADLYYRMGQSEKAIPLFEDILKHRKAKQDPRTPSAMQALGLAYKEAGRLAEAIPLLEEAAAKEPHPVRTRDVLDAYELAGAHAKVIALCQKQLAEDRKSKPDADPDTDLLARLGRAYLAQKQWSEAEPPLRQCVALREKGRPDDWGTFDAQSLLGGSLLGQKKSTDAEPLLLKGYEGLKQWKNALEPRDAPRLREAVERLVQFYEETDKKDEAAKWRKELAAIQAADKKPQEKP
jgi:WD40 repeat protein